MRTSPRRHADVLTGGRARISIGSVTTFVIAHALLVAVILTPIILGRRHAAQHRQWELKRRRVRCPRCGAVVRELRECAPQEHLPDLRA